MAVCDIASLQALKERETQKAAVYYLDSMKRDFSMIIHRFREMDFNASVPFLLKAVEKKQHHIEENGWRGPL